MATFGSRLLELRKREKKTQAEIAKYLNVTPKTISFYENNEREASNETLIKLAEYFNVSVDYLLGKDENKTQKDDEISGVYFSLAKEFQDNQIDPDDIKEAIDLIKKLRKK